MAETLPSISNVVPIVRAPTSPVSPADIAAPYAALAQSLNKIGEVVEKDIAGPFAEQAGRQAVTIGADGQPVIQKMPVFGAASAHYMRAAQFTALAETQPKVESRLTAMRLEYPNDPEGYRTAAASYIKEFTGGISDLGLRDAVRKAAVSHAEQNYRTTLVAFDHTNRVNALQSLQSRLADINQRGASIARQNGTDVPEYAQLHVDRAAIYGELVADPRHGFPQERADLEMKANRDADVVQAVVGNVVRQYQTKKNLPEAQKALQETFWGAGSELLNLTPAQRDHGVTEGLHALTRTTVEDKVAITAFHGAVTTYEDGIRKAPGNFDEGHHNNLLQRARELGDYQSIQRLNAVKLFAPFQDALQKLPPAERSKAFSDIARDVVPALPVRLANRDVHARIEAEAQRQGVSPQTALAVVAIESRGDPSAVSPSGKHRGLFQLSDDEFAMGGGVGSPHDIDQNIRAGVASIRAKSETFSKEFGRAPNATDIYLMHQQGEAGYRAHAANPDAPAWQNMLSTGEGKRKGEAWAKAAIWDNLPQSARDQFGSVERVTSADFIGVWRERVQGIPFEGTGLTVGQSGTKALSNPYVYRLWENTVKATREQLGHDAVQLADGIVKRAEAGDPVPPEMLQTFLDSALSGGKQNLINERVRPALAQYEARTEVRLAGPSPIAAMDSYLTALRSGGIADPVQYAAVTTLQRGLKEDGERWKKDPLSMGVTTRTIDPIHQINVNNPAEAAAEFQQRDTKLHILQNGKQGVGASTALTENEGETLAAALVRGNPDTAAALLTGMMQNLSQENRRATFADPPVRDALLSMIRSRDPVRMNAAFSVLDALWREDAWGFERTYKGTADHLTAWKGLKDSFSAQELAERLNKADDPSTIAARAELKTLAATELEGWFGHQAGDVAYALGQGWWGTGRITGATPSVPFDNVTARELVHDFGATYTALRQYGVDPAKAKELTVKRLTTGGAWGPSPIDNQLMRFPPSTYYPKVDGSYAWMRESLEAKVTAIKGPQVEAINPSAAGTVEGVTYVPKWSIKGLVTDSQTQAEIAAGKPPSYLVALDAGNGIEFLVDPNAPLSKRGGTGFRFDRDAHLAAAEERFIARTLAHQAGQAALKQAGTMIGAP